MSTCGGLVGYDSPYGAEYNELEPKPSKTLINVRKSFVIHPDENKRRQ